MKNSNEIVLLVAMRNLQPKKNDAELCISSHLFAQTYCKVHPCFQEVRRLFWEKMQTAELDFYGASVFQVLPSCWIRLEDADHNVNSNFCHIAATKADAESVMRSVSCVSIQSAFGYILAEHYS